MRVISADKSQFARETGRVFQHFGRQLLEHPGLTFDIWPFMEELQRRRERANAGQIVPLLGALTLVSDHLRDIWDNICSAVSGKIPLGIQEELVRAIGKYMKDVGESLLLPSKDMPLKYLEASDEFVRTHIRLKTDIQSSQEKKQTQVIHDLDTARLERRIKEPYKRKMIKLVVSTGCLEKSDEPVFMLRAGYRSFYFFSGAAFFHGARAPGEYVEIVKSSTTAFSELRRQFKASRDGSKTKGPQPHIVFTRRAAGETIGAASIASDFEAGLDMPTLMLPPPATESMIERIDGAELPPEGTPVVFMDDVVTTGLSAITWIKRLQALNLKVHYYYMAFDRRSTTADNFDEYPDTHVISALSKADLIAAGIWKPEILLCKADSKWLPAVDFTCDYLHECCIYYDQEGIYPSLQKELDSEIRKRVPDCSELDSPIAVQFYRNVALLYVLSLEPLFAKMRGAMNDIQR